MKRKTTLTLLVFTLVFGPSVIAQTLPSGYWTEAESSAILDSTMTVRLAPDMASLTAGEREAVERLLEAGELIHRLYVDSAHHQAGSAFPTLSRLNMLNNQSVATENLLTLFRLFSGPIATTLDNRRVPFLPVDPSVPGKNFYPWGIDRAEVEAFLGSHPEARPEILGERTVVRRATRANLERDLAALSDYPALDTLLPGLHETLSAMVEIADESALYAVPYSLAWADETVNLFELLNGAADAVEKSDSEFARYLRNRARDLLSNDYESGDASWVTGRFGRLNAQIGAYETYDDALFGVKAAWSLSLLLRDEAATAELREGLAGIQEIEDALPYEHHKRVRDDIPVGVYEVIADFGQARGTNTATILPNDALFSRRYGRTILLRGNIMKDPELFENTRKAWMSVMADEFDDDLVPDGGFQRTLWHEIGHYLGVDRDAQGRSLDMALEGYADALEEMKADLVSLFAAHEFAESGVHDESRLQAIRASGIRRTLQNNKPRPDQPYQTMQLSQFNYFLDHGLLEFDASRGELIVHYEKYREVVKALLEEVLSLQYAGDPSKAGSFFADQTRWDESLHGVIAQKIRDAQGPRYRLVRYAALGE